MQLTDLLLHPKTAAAIQQLLHSQAQAVILDGAAGSGKQTLAAAIAANVLGVPPDRLSVAPYYSLISPSNNTLTIDQVRELQRFLRLKTTGNAAIRRVAVLLHADTMNVQAQNALLKTLEEPPADTMLVLTVDDSEKLLPTVRSRARTIHIVQPTQLAVSEYLKEIPNDTVARAYAISGGAMGLLQQLVATDTSTANASAIELAKQLLGQTQYERLIQIDSLAKDKDQVIQLIIGLKRVCRGALWHAAERSARGQIAAWHRRLTAADTAEGLFARGTNAKLLLTDLFLHL